MKTKTFTILLLSLLSLIFQKEVKSTTISITNASWTSITDVDGDGFRRSGNLHLNITSDQNVFATFKIKYTIDGTNVYLYYQTPGGTLITSGNSVIDFEIGTSATGGELDHNVYDFIVQIYDWPAGTTQYSSRSYANDSDLDNEKCESVAQDQPTSNYNCIPNVDYISINGNIVNSSSTASVSLNNLSESFQIKLRGVNDGNDMAPANLSNLTLSFEQYTSASDKNLITINSSSSSDLSINKYFGTEAIGGDGYADYVLVEGTDNNGWTSGEGNNLYLDVKPKQWGQFVIEFRMGLPTDNTWTNFLHDPPGGYCAYCGEGEIGIDPIKFISYWIIVNVIQIPQSYTITTSSNPTQGGNTSGDGTYNSGTSCTVTASQNDCYQFTNWTENGTVVSNSASYTFTVNANRNLVANFAVINYTINTSSNPANGGNTSGSGQKACGSTCTVIATPNSCYQFTNWTENGTVVSNSTSYTFTVNANRNLVANFAVINYTINTSSNPTNGGNTSGSGQKACGSSCTVIATPNSCYQFTNWTENGTLVSNSTSYTFTVNANRNLVANFAVINYTINTSSNPTNGGNTSGGGQKACGSSCTVIATPNSCYQFTNWTENGTVVSNSTSYTFTVSANRNLVANFTVINYPINTSSNPTSGGNTSGSGVIACGSSCTVIATPNSCYQFTNSTENGTVVSNSTSYTFTVSANRNLVANFSAIAYVITTSSNPNSCGTTSGGGQIQCGVSATVIAYPGDCCQFTNWTENGTVVSNSASYTFTVNANRNLIANFTKIYFTIETISAPNDGGTTSGGGQKECGTQVTVTAVSLPGYKFYCWRVNDINIFQSEYTFTVTENETLEAHFLPDVGIDEYASSESYNLIVSPNPFLSNLKIQFELPEFKHVSIDLYDTYGRKIKCLLNDESLSSGKHEVEFDGNDIPAGVYLISTKIDDIRIVKKIIKANGSTW
jgi:hypothetical protein